MNSVVQQLGIEFGERKFVYKETLLTYDARVDSYSLTHYALKYIVRDKEGILLF